MDNLMRGRTSFVIATGFHHQGRRPDLVMRMVTLWSSTHDDLLAAGGFYADLYNSQFEDVSA